jgi:hypothetical protein
MSQFGYYKKGEEILTCELVGVFISTFHKVNWLNDMKDKSSMSYNNVCLEFQLMIEHHHQIKLKLKSCENKNLKIMDEKNIVLP